jgi:hypothetical protein
MIFSENRYPPRVKPEGRLFRDHALNHRGAATAARLSDQSAKVIFRKSVRDVHRSNSAGANRADIAAVPAQWRRFKPKRSPDPPVCRPNIKCPTFSPCLGPGRWDSRRRPLHSAWPQVALARVARVKTRPGQARGARFGTLERCGFAVPRPKPGLGHGQHEGALPERQSGRLLNSSADRWC